MTLAHQFWEGPLTKYQIASMKSYQQSGFEVILWSLSPKDNLPYGIVNKDANEIVNFEIIKSINVNGPTKEHATYATYSDIFRFRVLQKYGGWYFDSDTICNKSLEKFEQLKSSQNNYFICGIEREDFNNQPGIGVLSFTDQTLLDDIVRYQEKAILAKPSGWGSLGPSLFGNFLESKGMKKYLLEPFYFYKIPSTNAHTFYSDFNQDTLNTLSDSYVIHWWGSNSIYNIKKENSLIDVLCNQILQAEN